MLPAQYAETVRPAEPIQPERRLMLALLSDAIVVFQDRSAGVQRSRQREIKETERWILSNDRRWPCSFVNVCEALDLAYEPLRRALLRWRTAASARARPVARRRLLAGKALEPLASVG